MGSLDVAEGGKRSQPLPLSDVAWRATATDVENPYHRPRIGEVSTSGESLRVPVGTGSYLFAEAQAPSIEVSLRPGARHAARSRAGSRHRRVPGGDRRTSRPAIAARAGEYPGAAHRGLRSSLSDARSRRTRRRRRPPTYVAANFTRFGAVIEPSQWWLETPDERDVVAQLRAAPFSSLAATSRRARERALLEDPIPLGVIGALTLGFVVAAFFAAVGFAAGATAAARTRLLEFAVLRSLGLRTRQLSGWISIENGLVVVLSLLGGTALGLAVAWLVLPYVALGTSGEPPVPPVIVSVPWVSCSCSALPLPVRSPSSPPSRLLASAACGRRRSAEWWR